MARKSSGAVHSLKFAKSKPKGICQVMRCKNKARAGRAMCHSCKHRKWRMDHPVHAAYRMIVDRARRKKITCHITLVQFLELFTEAGYERGGNFHIDRKDATKGYDYGNLQVLLPHDNIAKGNKERTTEEWKAARGREHTPPLEHLDEPDPF